MHDIVPEPLPLTPSDSALFRRVADASPSLVLVYRLDPPGYVYVSPSSLPLLGYTPEEFYTNPGIWRRIVHPHDAGLEHALADERTSGEFRAFHRDGRMRWFEREQTLVRDDQGKALALHGVARDISSRKEVEHAVRESEARYRTLFDAHPQAMWVFDYETMRFLAVNDAALAFYGYSKDEFLSMTILDIRPPEDQALLSKLLRESPGHALTPSAWRHRRKSGELVDVFVSAHPLDFGGRAARLVMVQDLTAQRRAEAELVDSERRFRALFESARDAIIVTEGGRVIDCNDATAALFGHAKHEIVGKPIGSFSAAVDGFDDGQLARALPDHDAQTAKGWSIPSKHLRADGTIVDTEITLSPIDVNGKRLVQGIIRDVSERRKAEEERASLQRALLQAQKMESVGRLAGGVAHDFNNLLTVISGYANLLLDEPEALGALRSRVSEIALAADRARELTSKLLIFSRKHPYEPRPVAVDRFLGQELRLLRRLLSDRIEVDLRFASGEAFVRIDPAQLSQVLMNLVVNARDAMPQGGRLAIATTPVALDERRAQAQGRPVGTSYVSLAVSDTGCGMTTEVQSHLFEPFFTTKHLGQGTGLGLATVYGLVQQAGGFIEVASAVSQGTTMTVFFPVSTAAAEPKKTERKSRTLAGHETILVVEDDDTVRLVTTTILQRLGYTIVEADRPEAAIRLMDEGLQPHLIITDVVMPDMDGRRLVAELERMASGFEVLYISGFAEIEDANELLADPERFLAKPFTPEALAQRVRDLLNSREQAT